MAYNGSKNYETWNVGLWLDNDQEPHFHFTERAAELDGEIQALALEMEQWVDARPGFSDLDANEMRSVDWLEIAEGFIQAARENAAADKVYEEG